MSMETGLLITLKRHKKIMRVSKAYRNVNCFLLRAVLVESCKNTRKQKPKQKNKNSIPVSISEIGPNGLKLIYEIQIT